MDDKSLESRVTEAGEALSEGVRHAGHPCIPQHKPGAD